MFVILLRCSACVLKRGICKDAISPVSPVTVEHAAVGAAGQQAGRCGRGGAGLGCGSPFQEGVGVESLQGDLLEAVCFCRGETKGGVTHYGPGSGRDAGGCRQVGTHAGCPWRAAHPTRELQTPSRPRSCCCDPALILSRWTAAWTAGWAAPRPAFRLLSQRNSRCSSKSPREAKQCSLCYF